jgi:hypothetical protein
MSNVTNLGLTSNPTGPPGGSVEQSERSGRLSTIDWSIVDQVAIDCQQRLRNALGGPGVDHLRTRGVSVPEKLLEVWRRNAAEV